MTVLDALDADYTPSPQDLKVVYCPVDPLVGLPMYGTRAVFTRLEASLDLRAGNYPEGMVLQSEGRYWKVAGRGHVMLACDRYGRPTGRRVMETSGRTLREVELG